MTGLDGVPDEVIPPFVGTVWLDPATGESHVYLHANKPGVTPRQVMAVLGVVIAQLAAQDPNTALPVGEPVLPGVLADAIAAARAAQAQSQSPEPASATA